MTMGPAHDGLNARHQFALIKRFRQIIIGAIAQALDFVFHFSEPGQDKDRCVDTGIAKTTQNFVSINIG